MKPFDLKLYTSNPNLEIITREGNPAKIIYTNRKGYNVKPVVALITIPNGTEVIKTYWENGIETQGYTDNPNDLFFKPVKRIGWINIYNMAFKCLHICIYIYIFPLTYVPIPNAYICIRIHQNIKFYHLHELQNTYNAPFSKSFSGSHPR